MGERLRGMFAVAAWDREERHGVLIRDRLGIKPLYWARSGNLLLFGSELKCLLASDMVSDELDPEAIAAYLTLGYVPGAMTPLRQVRKLGPGERLVVARGRFSVERWWSYPAPVPEQRPEEEWAELLLDKLDESVRLRLMSDVPLGAMLSGGLDSSLIVALMRRHMTEPLKTFSVGFAGADSELGDARRVADWNGADHTELEVTLDTGAEDLQDLVWHLDEPLADLSALGFLPLCRLAREQVTVALTGQGADELLGGTAWPRWPRHGGGSPARSAPPRPPRSATDPGAPGGWWKRSRRTIR
jgi:asparagine synthase (glutamine-hydrolysing)